MTEFSGLWTTGGAGDGASTYTRANLSDFFKVLGACMDNEGVAPAYLNALAGSANGANSARIATGGALVDGIIYTNSANVDTAIPSAVGGGNTRIDRLVLRADWAAQTVRVTRIAGTDAGSPTAPSITQTPGTTYDILLCQVLVNTSGVVTITDERTFAKPGTNAIVTAAITDLAVTTDKIAADAVTLAKIPDRTRSFLVTAHGQQTAAASPDTGYSAFGVTLADNTELVAYGFFRVPTDFVSGLTVTPIVRPNASGNLRWDQRAYAAAVGEEYTNHSHSTAVNTLAVTGSQINALTALSVSSAAAADYISMDLTRYGDNPADTIGNSISLVGWLVSYTADS